MASKRQEESAHKSKKRRAQEKTFTHQEPDLRQKKRIFLDKNTVIWIGIDEDENEARQKYLDTKKFYTSQYDLTITRAKKKEFK